MIPVNELRVGVMVMHSQFSSRWNKEKYFACEIKDFAYPIPLTAEWLEKFEWEHIEYRSKWQKHGYPFQLEDPDEEDAGYLLLFDNERLHEMPTIKYVHQLQNLNLLAGTEEPSQPQPRAKPFIISVHNEADSPGAATVKLLRYKELERPNNGNPPEITITLKDPNSTYVDFVGNAHDKQKILCNFIRVESGKSTPGALLWNEYHESSGKVVSQPILQGPAHTMGQANAEGKVERYIDGNSEIEMSVKNGDTITVYLYPAEVRIAKKVMDKDWCIKMTEENAASIIEYYKYHFDCNYNLLEGKGKWFGFLNTIAHYKTMPFCKQITSLNELNHF